ncbi:unnamed protein product [Sphenostylis stenocarpa]|uniref:Uncharacterized protein n=1 Tax=Sphenostylis stenocarpa TaxID=92480 RepID=A0AA86VL11_9FABA|nr:unnamed protein product [Sphenostylis stenocarpa]
MAHAVHTGIHQQRTSTFKLTLVANSQGMISITSRPGAAEHLILCFSLLKAVQLRLAIHAVTATIRASMVRLDIPLLPIHNEKLVTHANPPELSADF